MQNLMSSAEKGNASYIENLLNQLGFEKVRRKGGSRPGFTACCLFHGERNPSFSIGDTGLWKCWTCGEQGNLKQLVERLGNGTMDWRESLRMVGVQLRKSFEPRPAKKLANLPEDFSEYTMPAEVPAVISKRLKWETIRRFHLGQCSQRRIGDKFNPNYGRCIIPIFHKGKCVGYHGRALRDDVQPKYYNAEFDIKEFLFNFDGCKQGQEVVVVEGAFNAMSMVEKGFPNTVATFGTQFLAPQIEKLASLRPASVTICFDRDRSKVKEGKEVGRAGQRATLKLGRMLDDLFRVEVMVMPFEKDPNDLPADVLAECHRRRVPFSAIAGEK